MNNATRNIGVNTRVKLLRSFTLVELLIVIAILAVLAAAVVLVLNPAELLAQARDSQRITDMRSTRSAIDLFIIDNPTISSGTASRIYISIPDTASNCPNLTSSLPTLPSGWQYVCATSANLRNINGTGWIPIDFSIIKGGSPIPYLPIDPANDLTSGKYYTYVTGGSYELTALMEANKESASVNDGGSLPGVYQVGTHIDLTPPTRDRGLIGYWMFDGSGSITNGQAIGLSDASGRGNNGTASNVNTTGMSFATGKVGNAVQFDGADDCVDIPTISLGNTNWTAAMWVKTASIAEKSLLSNSSGGPVQNLLGMNISKILYRHYDGVWRYEYGTSSVISDNNWHHLVWVNRSDRTIDLYVDGVKESTALPSLITNTGPLNRLGGSWSGSHFWIGFIDEVRVYNRSLLTSEINNIYDATK